MLACIQRRQNLSSKRLVCTPNIVDFPPLPVSLPAPPLLPWANSGEPASMTSQYPSPAELDAFAHKTANCPLSIKIFPSNIRVPQHKQLNRTVNGLDTTGQHYTPYSHRYSGGYQGLLAIVEASVVVKGVVKNSEGKRTKHVRTQTTVAPYNNTLNNSYTATRHGHKAFHISSCKPPDMPTKTLSSTAMTTSEGQGLVPQSELAEVHSLIKHMNCVPHSQTLQLGGQASPSLRAVAAVAYSESGFVFGVAPQSSLALSGAVLPTQSADMAKVGYLDKANYNIGHKQQHQIQQQQHHQQYNQQGTSTMYNNGQGCRGAEAVVSQSPETCLPLVCSTQLSYRCHPISAGINGDRPGQASSSPVNCTVMHGELSAGQHVAPPWENVLATPHSDCFTSQDLAAGPSMGRPRDMGLSHPHPHPGRHHHHHHSQHHQLYPPLHPQHSTDQSLWCGLPNSRLCYASVLSSSLQSLECLISEIHPSCIKERMLGRGYEAMGMPRLMEHHQHTHIQLPVYDRVFQQNRAQK
ncbi:protein FAM222A-like [Lampris incognitus]|uniref:protein FAM222A-like n=1 Tax=Lampris incognitus TaxID=2546036 RepID=UPI0024B56F18|nr:protein FAM222A-like [Lampris incognitus]